MSRTDKLSPYRTRIVAGNGSVQVIYVSTLIVDATPHAVTLHSGGWRTVTTKRKMNQAARQFDLGYSVWQKAGDWFVSLRDGRTLDFEDGMTIPR